LHEFDAVLMTTPNIITKKIAPDLPKDYLEVLDRVRYQWATCLVLALDRPLTPYYITKKGKRYRYYISHPDHLDDDRLHQRPGTNWRLSGLEIERRVGEVVEAMVSDGAELVRVATTAQLNAAEIDTLLRMIEDANRDDHLGWVASVILHEYQISVTAQIPASTPIRLKQTLPMIMKRRGVERRLVIAPDKIKTAEPDPQILKTIRIGFKFWEQLQSDHPLTAVDFAKRECVDNRYVGRALSLTFLAPDIVERFISGRHLPSWTAKRLSHWDPLPVLWNEQREIFDTISPRDPKQALTCERQLRGDGASAVIRHQGHGLREWRSRRDGSNRPKTVREPCF